MEAKSRIVNLFIFFYCCMSHFLPLAFILKTLEPFLYFLPNSFLILRKFHENAKTPFTDL